MTPCRLTPAPVDMKHNVRELRSALFDTSNDDKSRYERRMYDSNLHDSSGHEILIAREQEA